MNTELHLKYRPTMLEQMAGQKTAVTQLKSFFDGDGITLPHTCLLQGPSGTGKTTAARILARMLGCPPNEQNPNYVERNCADCRSIDDVREIKDAMRYGCLGNSNARVWVLDEVVQLPTITQQAFLKILEEPPPHVWFFLCTTDSSALIPTLKSRCHPIQFQEISRSVLTNLATRIAAKEGTPIDTSVAEAIGQKADGSARQALVLLEVALAHEETEAQIAAIQSSSHTAETIELARAIHKRASQDDLIRMAGSLKADFETVRRAILGYTDVVMIKNPRKDNREYCYRIIQAFRDSWISCGRSGLLSAVYEISERKR